MKKKITKRAKRLLAQDHAGYNDRIWSIAY
jgi:hypothetical protein